MVLCLGLVGLTPTEAAFAQACRCEVSPTKLETYDRALSLSEASREQAQSIHLPYGLPRPTQFTTNERTLWQGHYVTGYDEDLRVPLWAAYRLRRADISKRKRTQCFRRDPRLPRYAAAFCPDYKEPIFDRGHLVPSADMTRSEAAMVNTYVLSNVVPQHNRFNGGVWASLEQWVRRWAKKRGVIHVVTGSVFDRDKNGVRDPDMRARAVHPRFRIAVPSHFYKILLFRAPNGFVQALSMVLPHEDRSIPRREQRAYVERHLRSIDEIEAQTGMDLFSGLPEPQESAVESYRARRLWPLD